YYLFFGFQNIRSVTGIMSCDHESDGCGVPSYEPSSQQPPPHATTPDRRFKPRHHWLYREHHDAHNDTYSSCLSANQIANRGNAPKSPTVCGSVDTLCPVLCRLLFSSVTI